MSEAGDWVVVLAAGRGSRMGGPKALMTMGGETWWRVQMRRLGEAGLRQVWVVSDAVRDAMEAGEPSSEEVEWLVVADADAPMFESVLAGVSALEGEDGVRGVFVLPVDIPAARAKTWEALRGGADDVRVPVFGSGAGHPIWLGWDFVTAHVLPAPVDSRLDALTADVAQLVPVDDPSVAANLNTPGDVEVWLRGRR